MTKTKKVTISHVICLCYFLFLFFIQQKIYIYITKTNDMRNSNFLCFCHLSLLYI